MILNVAYLLISSMCVGCGCSKFTPILFYVACLNNQSPAASCMTCSIVGNRRFIFSRLPPANLTSPDQQIFLLVPTENSCTSSEAAILTGFSLPLRSFSNPADYNGC